MNSDKENNAGLSGEALLEGIPREKVLEISRRIKDTTVPSGTMIFQQGDPGDAFYLIRSGKVRVFRKSEHGVETHLSEMGPGESFGEMALLTGKTRSANVETLEETCLGVLTKDEFDQ